VTNGLGYGVQIASLNIRTGRAFCYLLAIGVLGTLISVGVDSALSRTVWWADERR
jgi:ABC-type nitrate/sulfonate/bicarbonate transport system permease component